MAVLRIYVENQATLEPILFYCSSKCNQTKEEANEDCLCTHNTHIFFLCDYYQFFSFSCQNTNITGSNCAIVGCNLSKKQISTVSNTADTQIT